MITKRNILFSLVRRKRLIHLLSVLLATTLVSCNNQDLNQGSYFNIEKAKFYFDKIEASCYNDGGTLWGRNLYGPLMFVDRRNRIVYSNFPDREGNLKKSDGVYYNNYSKDFIINRDSLTFGGTKYALAALPSKEDGFTITSRGIQSLYYFHQHYFGYKPIPYNTSNMDEDNARLWLKLELKALKKAITSDNQERNVALRDALIFRGSNHELYSKYVNDEIRFENYEGLAVFTSLLLSSTSQEELSKELLESIDIIYSLPTFARSYGGFLGAAYAYLAYDKAFLFSSIKSVDTDLSKLVQQLYDIQLPEFCRDVAGSIALNYDLSTVQAEEDIRKEQIKERIQQQTSQFTNKPVILIDLISPYFDYEQTDIVPVSPLGTIYNRLIVADNWGKIIVEEGGCLLSENLKHLTITADNYHRDRNHLYGDGWMLTLNSNWEIIKDKDNYIIKRTLN